MADVRATDLTPETAATLNGAEEFVMFDSAEGKRCSVDNLHQFLHTSKGCMERKNVRCNATVASSDRAGFNFKQEVTWQTMTANDYVDGFISAGSYNGVWAIESAADKAILWFVTQPSTSVYVNIFREVTTNV